MVRIQKKRYKDKGLLNSAIGVALFFTVFWVIRKIGQSIWPAYVEDKLQFTFVGSLVLKMMCQFIPFFICVPGYLGLSSYHQKYLVNKKSKWAWKMQNWPQVLKKTFFNLLINQLCVYPIFSYYSTSKAAKFRFQDFPSYFQLIIQILFFFYVQDFFFYWAHRFAHQYFYKLHKIHHQYQKVYTFVAEYFHPLDYIVANILPSAAGLIILGSRVHCFTFFYWIFWKSMIGIEGHSGYEFPWSPMKMAPFVFGASYHDHHHSNNVGNYSGSCYFWDLMLQTGDVYIDSFLKEQAKAQ